MERIKVAIVTGASSGIGKCTAQLLSDHGFRVFGTSRRPAEWPAGKVKMLQLDVRSDASVLAALSQVLDASGRIDLLVNNAGVLQASLMEETDFKDARSLFETNFFGVVRMNRAVLPVMREHRSGRIVTIGSLAGIVGIPGESFYSASKFALRGFCEVLAHEVRSFGIHVSLVEPGFFRTGLARNAVLQQWKLKDYDGIRDIAVRATLGGLHGGADPERVAALVLRIAGKRRPKIRYRVGRDALWVPPLKALVPDALFAAGMRRWLRCAASDSLRNRARSSPGVQAR